MHQVLLRIDNSLYEKLREIAKRDSRSINSLLNVLVKRCISQENKSAA